MDVVVDEGSRVDMVFFFFLLGQTQGGQHGQEAACAGASPMGGKEVTWRAGVAFLYT